MHLCKQGTPLHVLRGSAPSFLIPQTLRPFERYDLGFAPDPLSHGSSPVKKKKSESVTATLAWSQHIQMWPVVSTPDEHRRGRREHSVRQVREMIV